MINSIEHLLLGVPPLLVYLGVTLVVGVAAATQFKTGGTGQQFQLTETHTWIKQIGASYALGVDGISLALILMSLVLVPVSILAAWRDVDGESDNTGSSKLKVRNTDTSRSNNDTTRERVIRQLRRVLDRVNSEKRHMTKIA